MTFEEYLMGIHGKDYIGTDDDMPDDFERWLMDKEIDEIIQLADDYGAFLRRQHGNN